MYTYLNEWDNDIRAAKGGVGKDFAALFDLKECGWGGGEGFTRVGGSRSGTESYGSKVTERNKAVAFLEVLNNPFGVLSFQGSLKNDLVLITAWGERSSTYGAVGSFRGYSGTLACADILDNDSSGRGASRSNRDFDHVPCSKKPQSRVTMINRLGITCWYLKPIDVNRVKREPFSPLWYSVSMSCCLYSNSKFTMLQT